MPRSPMYKDRRLLWYEVRVLKIRENIRKEYVDNKVGKSYSRVATIPHIKHLERMIFAKVMRRRSFRQALWQDWMQAVQPEVMITVYLLLPIFQKQIMVSSVL
jgi:hypothetical protein